MLFSAKLWLNSGQPGCLITPLTDTHQIGPLLARVKVIALLKIPPGPTWLGPNDLFHKSIVGAARRIFIFPILFTIHCLGTYAINSCSGMSKRFFSQIY